MTRSAGVTGLIFAASPPSLSTASLIAAKSTTAGTPLNYISKILSKIS